MGNISSSSSSVPAISSGDGALLVEGNTPDASLSSNNTTAEENARKRKQHAHLTSAAVAAKQSRLKKSGAAAAGGEPDMNVVEQIYNEDFDTIDHIQAMRFPPYVAKQIKDAVRNESERRCAEKEKTMARCLQDKMWTSWKCQKERDVYYHCVEDEEKRNTNPHRPVDEVLDGAQQTGEVDSFVDLLTAYRWKFNLGVLHGEIIGRNNIMRKMWKEHFPDRELPHPWVKDEE